MIILCIVAPLLSIEKLDTPFEIWHFESLDIQACPEKQSFHGSIQRHIKLIFAMPRAQWVAETIGPNPRQVMCWCRRDHRLSTRMG